MYVCMYVCVCMYVYVCVSKCAYVCVQECMYVYVCMSTNTSRSSEGCITKLGLGTQMMEDIDIFLLIW